MTGLLRSLALAAVMLGALAPPALAARAEAVIELLRLDEVLEIMRVEGMEHGEAIGAGLVAAQDEAAWAAAVRRIYDPERMRATMAEGLDDALPSDPGMIGHVEGFFTSDLGRRVLELEVSARRAMLDDAVEELARAGWSELEEEDGPRAAALRRFVAVGDLVEQNVVGGLNSTYAFYAGLRDSGAGGIDGAGMLDDVRGQEAAIRAEVDEWLHAYLALAFGPLEPAELEAYTAFFDTPSGRVLNAALFEGFNGMFEALSRQLGQAAGGLMLGEDL